MELEDALDYLRAAERQQGVIEGLKIAVASARQQAGDCFALGQDDDARTYRTLARLFALKQAEAEKEYVEKYKMPSVQALDFFLNSLEDAEVLRYLQGNCYIAYGSPVQFKLVYDHGDNWWHIFRANKKDFAPAASSPQLDVALKALDELIENL